MSAAASVRPSAAPSPTLSIVLATLNERANLPELISRIRHQTLPTSEIIVVDDGSTDGTREFLRELAATDPGLRLLFHEGKQTTLRAQYQGIEAAVGQYVAVMDAGDEWAEHALGKLAQAVAADRGAAPS